MLNSIMKNFFLWLYGLFLELISFCANQLLGIMNTDLAFFESNVPVVVKLYKIFVAIGWGLLIGNCIFQSMKSMFAGLGVETESPYILLLRTFMYGFLLFSSQDICRIGLDIGSKIIKIIGIPKKVKLKLPTESFFEGTKAAWLLVIIIGLFIGIQLIKLFFEIGERYAVIGVLTLVSPMGFAMGGSKATKDIFAGFIRTYVSMIVLLISNVLFLKLILSALSKMPKGLLVLPWSLLVIGLAKTARKADNILSKIGMNPAITGDPLGHGTGKMAALMAARSIINSAAHSNNAGRRSTYTSGNYSNTNNSTAGSRNFGNTNQQNRTGPQTVNTGAEQSNSSSYSSGSSTVSNSGKNGNTFVGGTAGPGNMPGGNTKVNTNRFGSVPVSGKTGTDSKAKAGAGNKNANTKKAPAKRMNSQSSSKKQSSKSNTSVGNKSSNKGNMHNTAFNKNGKISALNNNKGMDNKKADAFHEKERFGSTNNQPDNSDISPEVTPYTEDNSDV